MRRCSACRRRTRWSIRSVPLPGDQKSSKASERPAARRDALVGQTALLRAQQDKLAQEREALRAQIEPRDDRPADRPLTDYAPLHGNLDAVFMPGGRAPVTGEVFRTGKPLLVVLRCVPCLSCVGLDAEVLIDPTLAIPDIPLAVFLAGAFTSGAMTEFGRLRRDPRPLRQGDPVRRLRPGDRPGPRSGTAGRRGPRTR